MNIAILKSDSPFFPLFPGGAVPIVNVLLPGQAECEGDGVQDVYMVDLNKLQPGTLDAVVDMIRKQQSPCLASAAVVKSEILKSGLPLRAKHVSSVSTDSRFFL